jgi:hypothetical protein
VSANRATESTSVTTTCRGARHGHRLASGAGPRVRCWRDVARRSHRPRRILRAPNTAQQPLSAAVSAISSRLQYLVRFHHLHPTRRCSRRFRRAPSRARRRSRCPGTDVGRPRTYARALQLTPRRARLRAASSFKSRGGRREQLSGARAPCLTASRNGGMRASSGVSSMMCARVWRMSHMITATRCVSNVICW